ncbi:MAG: metallophosphoesterase family protein [Methyloligellaceae bacterium]
MFRLSKTLGAVPDNYRLYAIGDIHGRADLLMRLIDTIMEDSEGRRKVRNEVLIFLGDYIDRGPESNRVIDFLVNHLPERFDKVFLKGNHEQMMLEAIQNKQALPTWFHNGGKATLYSYGIDPEKYIFKPGATQILGELLEQKMPLKHKDFFKGLDLNTSYGDYFFVHAGVNPALSLDEQKERDMLWIRQRFLQYRRKFEKTVVHGHTITASPEVRSNRVGIDTGAWRTGRLTALRLQNKDYGFLHT